MLTMRRVTKATELKRFKELEGEYHYMGETHSGGDTMRLVFEEDGKWVALMVWGSACYHLKPRDAYVGWANSIRAERLKLVVNNRRFTILSEPGERSTGMSQRQTKSPYRDPRCAAAHLQDAAAHLPPASVSAMLR